MGKILFLSYRRKRVTKELHLGNVNFVKGFIKMNSGLSKAT